MKARTSLIIMELTYYTRETPWYLSPIQPRLGDIKRAAWWPMWNEWVSALPTLPRRYASTLIWTDHLLRWAVAPYLFITWLLGWACQKNEGFCHMSTFVLETGPRFNMSDAPNSQQIVITFGPYWPRFTLVKSGGLSATRNTPPGSGLAEVVALAGWV